MWSTSDMTEETVHTGGVTHEGRFLVQRGGKGFAARVSIAFERAPGTPRLELACTGPGVWRGQGSLDDVGPHDHLAWQAGARLGAAFALRIAGLAGAGVRIIKIVGMTTDTNPTIVAAAAARAVWAAAGFTPPAGLLARFEAQVFSSCQLDWEALPDFDAL
jgi:hypothetical protein